MLSICGYPSSYVSIQTASSPGQFAREEANLGLKDVAEEFGISAMRVSKLEGKIERMENIDLSLRKLLRKYKVKQ